MRAVRAFARKYSDIQVRVIDVFEERELSDRISKELDIGHASPQA
jgi:bacillithiol system protein YtxJ